MCYVGCKGVVAGQKVREQYKTIRGARATKKKDTETRELNGIIPGQLNRGRGRSCSGN